MKNEETVVVIPYEDPIETLVAFCIMIYSLLVGTYGILRFVEVMLPTINF